MRFLVSLVLVVVAGCADVAPWQRAKLSHPSMAESEESPARAHREAVQEGASGGGEATHSGCGCN